MIAPLSKIVQIRVARATTPTMVRVAGTNACARVLSNPRAI